MVSERYDSPPVFVVRYRLDAAQRRVVELAACEGRNVFFTGSGGVGKSFVTNTLIAFLRDVYGEEGFKNAVARFR